MLFCFPLLGFPLWTLSFCFGAFHCSAHLLLYIICYHIHWRICQSLYISATCYIYPPPIPTSQPTNPHLISISLSSLHLNLTLNSQSHLSIALSMIHMTARDTAPYLLTHIRYTARTVAARFIPYSTFHIPFHSIGSPFSRPIPIP
ncbi:hypothetical protein C8R44DRAFT_776168 [Mycena epipterygia]|nr:hypothetical protein C8R44DRAFT_776168 [Mycena epipterygia]